MAQPAPISAKGFLHGRLSASDAGWPTRSGTGPSGAYESAVGTEFVMVLGSRREAVDAVYARAGEYVLVQQTADLTDVEVLSFNYHFTQIPANADGLLWSLEILIDGELRYRVRPAAGTEAFFLRRGVFVDDLAGDHTITMRMQLEG